MSLDDTIVALSTPPGEGGIGIVRLSGRDAVAVAEKVFHSLKGKKLRDAQSHTILHGFVIDPATDERIDEVLATVMRAPRTYTREDVVEINCHGGMLPLRRTLQVLLKEGARLAEPGEFTKRAFLNGRIDLSQAEAVIDVIRAKTDQAERFALQQLEGKLSEKIHWLRDRITDLCVHVEAYIDFPEDEIETLEKSEIVEAMSRICSELLNLSRGYGEARFFREGVATAIVGKPNVGKSSLLNALLQRDRAIVTESPGTTRDVIEEYLNIHGLPIRVMDTAGIRETHDLAEIEGVKRSLRAIADADIVLAVLDASRPLDGADRELVDKVKHKKTVFVLNKNDIRSHAFRVADAGLAVHESFPGAECRHGPVEPSSPRGERELLTDSASDTPYTAVWVSALRGEGIDDLKDTIYSLVISRDFSSLESPAESVLITNVRHKHSIDRALTSLQQARETLKKDEPLEVMALFLRESLDFLGEIIGLVSTEDLLNRIFSEFCLGK